MLGTLTPTQVEKVLQDGVIGRIGCISEGRPYVVPVCYAYDQGCVYGHSVDGAKLRAFRDNPLVCFEVEAVDDLSNWRSVVSWGTAEELHGSDANRGMRLLIEQVMPRLPVASVSAHPDARVGHLAASVYRITIQESTGRFESTDAGPQSPGVSFVGDPSVTP